MEPHHHTHAFTSDGPNLTPQDVAKVARSGAAGEGSGDGTPTYKPAYTVGVSSHAQERVRWSRAIVDDIVERGEVVYGITTGFGAFKDKVISHDDLAQLQVNLILSQCVGMGPALPREVVRALMLCRAHTLSLGYSGLRPETLDLIYSMLNAGVHPLIPEQGSVGASGDLAPLSHMALGMLGGGQAEYGGRFMPASEALSAAGLQPARLCPKEGLALSNGTSLMSALLTLALVDAQTLCDTADVVGAMSLEALQGVPYAFDPRIHAARRHTGQIATAARIRALTQGSTLMWHDTPGDGVEKAVAGKVQDAYSLRCMPQVHGPVKDACAYVEGVLLNELNGANDNPLVFSNAEGGMPNAESGEPNIPHYAVLSGGNFHGAPLSLASDFLAIALCQLGTISERRQARLVDVAAHGGLFPPFLIEHGGLNSGFMMVQYTAAALASENKSLAHPASVDTIPTSANVEDHVSMGPIAARHARAIVANTARILALEALTAAQAIDFRLRAQGLPARLGVGTRLAYDLVRQQIPFLERDEDFQPHIAAVERLVVSGRLGSVVNTQSGARDVESLPI